MDDGISFVCGDWVMYAYGDECKLSAAVFQLIRTAQQGQP